MSSVGDADRGEAGGLQGTAQNIGSSLGVALIGAILIASLGTGLNDSVQAEPSISAESKAAVAAYSAGGVDIVNAEQLDAGLAKAGITGSDATAIVKDYEEAQIQAIKKALLLAALFAAIGIGIARRLPRIPGVDLTPETINPPAAASA
jgi:hypothetical protein